MTNGAASVAGPTSRRRILVIEDEPDLARGLRDALEFEQFEVSTAGQGREGIARLREAGTDLVILDLMLPDINGFSVCEQIRQSHPVVPIIMLTARSQETDKIRGLEAGADDYVTKPFSVGELVARINAIFRRLHRSTATDEAIRIGQVTVYPRRHELVRNRKTLPLSFYEVEILRLLHERKGEPVAREEIMEKIWGLTGYGSSRSVDNFVVKLRKKIEENASSPRHIVTIYGTGYKLLL
ncbi:MAG: response regulator transcription factor [Deltaproteobacteria bacterium]|nr:response regulator transcription factor [Deltaproteobacteria bacterium]